MTVDLDPGLLSSAEASALGVSRSRLVGGYRRVARGLYVPMDTDLRGPAARIAVVARQLPAGFAGGGWAAARLHEASVRPDSDELTVFDGRLPEMDPEARTSLPIMVCCGPTRRRRPGPGTVLFRSELAADDVTTVSGVPVTSAARTAFDLARLWPTTAGVVALDRLRALGAVSGAEVAEEVAAHPSWQGVERARLAVSLSSDGVESPRETMMRLLWLAAGLPRPACNAVVHRVGGGFLARPDLLDDAVGLVAEYDGEHHAPAPRRRSDAARQEAMESAGLVVVRAHDGDISDPAGRRQWSLRLRAAHARASSAPRPRSWRVH